jgi:hypothetical protein
MLCLLHDLPDLVNECGGPFVGQVGAERVLKRSSGQFLIIDGKDPRRCGSKFKNAAPAAQRIPALRAGGGVPPRDVTAAVRQAVLGRLPILLRLLLLIEFWHIRPPCA